MVKELDIIICMYLGGMRSVSKAVKNRKRAFRQLKNYYSIKALIHYKSTSEELKGLQSIHIGGNVIVL